MRTPASDRRAVSPLRRAIDYTTKASDWLGRRSPKWSISRRVGRRTSTQSADHYAGSDSLLSDDEYRQNPDLQMFPALAGSASLHVAHERLTTRLTITHTDLSSIYFYVLFHILFYVACAFVTCSLKYVLACLLLTQCTLPSNSVLLAARESVLQPVKSDFYILLPWLDSRVVSVLDSDAEGPGSSHSRDAVG